MCSKLGTALAKRIFLRFYCVVIKLWQFFFILVDGCFRYDPFMKRFLVKIRLHHIWAMNDLLCILNRPFA